jgi:hypothetical protein
MDNLEQYDEELIKRWTESTYLSLTDRFEALTMWQVTIPAIALDQPFLRHGLLALSSMHTRYTSPLPLQSRYLDLASQHQAQALAGYIPELRTVTQENCHPLFAFSALLLPIQYSFISAVGGETEGEEVLSEITSVFDYVIGATVIAHEGRSWLRKGSLLPLMTRRTEPENILPYLLKEPQDALRSLMNYVEHLAPMPEKGASSETLTKIPIYVRGIVMLTNAFPTEDRERRIFDDMVGWSHYVGGDFVRLLKERDPVSLVILAHYGVALNAFNDFWWLEGVGSRLIRAVSSVLSPAYLPLIQWPLNAIAVGQGSHPNYIL